MTQPIKPPPGFLQHYIFDLLTGRKPRKIYLPPNVVGRINHILKEHGLSIRIFTIETIKDVPDEGSS